MRRSAPTQSNWHALHLSELQRALGIDTHPLSDEEVAIRLNTFGPNLLPVTKRPNPLRRLFKQFNNLLIYIMLIAALMTGALGDWTDAGVLLGAVLVNVIIGFLQEGKAEAALEALNSMLPLEATVVRSSGRRRISVSQLVPGDHVLIASGDRIPADLRLIHSWEFRVDESPLTGESVPVEKNVDICTSEAPISERANMAFSGTFAVHGRAEGIVVETGVDTELGKINSMLSRIPDLSTPLIRQINRFGRQLAMAICGLAALVFWLGLVVKGLPANEMLTLVVAFAASAIPEGLPAIITITLALSVQQMARRKAIIRKLPAVESLGSVSTICTDKTGTLTRNEMTAQQIVTADCVLKFSGSGFDVVGDLLMNNVPVHVAPGQPAERILIASALCNEAVLTSRGTELTVHGDPTEIALLIAAAKADIWQEELNKTWPRHDVMPFESSHRLMAIRVSDPLGNTYVFAKGAPEQIMELCQQQLTAAGLQLLQVEFWKEQLAALASAGLRVLALAYQSPTSLAPPLTYGNLPKNLILLGLVGIADPPRPEALRAIQDCHAAGITVKMFTGDHLITARAIGRQLGIGLQADAVDGSSLSNLDDKRFEAIARSTEIFARTSPADKFRLVQTLQSGGEIVAMTGDGVNDAPALKQADIGVAMGLKGTEVARQAADIVLADDNFATIIAAIQEGRVVYENIKKFILFILPTNGGEALVVVASLFLNAPLALTAAQILWINLVTSSTLGLALAFEPPEKDIMRRPPRPPRKAILSRFFVWRLVYVSILMTAAALGLFIWEYESGSSLAEARTMCVTSLVMCEIFYLFCSRSFFESIFSWKALSGNRAVLLTVLLCLVLQWTFSELSVMRFIFESVSLTAVQWLKAAGAALLVPIGSETEKWLLRRFSRLPGSAAQV